MFPYLTPPHKTFILTLLIFSVSIALAQEAKKSNTFKSDTVELLDMAFEDLMKIRVITPTQSLQNSGQAPASVLIVTRDQIKLRGYRNLAEILNDLPDFTVQHKADPQFYSLINIRGISRPDYFVILLDGVRISSPTNEPLPLLENFPIYLAKQIEVVYGPGSALYGADAMAGVINIITGEHTGNEKVSVATTGGTQGYHNIFGLFKKKFKDDTRISFGGQYSYDIQPNFSKVYKNEYSMSSQETKSFNTSYGLVAPKQPIDPSYDAPIKAYNAYVSLDKGGFSLKILHHHVQVPSSTTLTPNNAVYNKDVFYGQGITMASGSYSITAGKFKSASTLTASFYKVNPRSNFRNVFGGMEHGYKYSSGSTMKVEEQLTYSLSDKLNFIGGITYEIFQSIPKSPELQSPIEKNSEVRGVLLNSTSKNNPNGIEAEFFPLLYTNFGSYLQGQYYPSTNFSLTAGVRYDHNSRFGSTINPRIGAVATPFKKTTLKLLYGTAFWAPSPHISYQSYGAFYSLDDGITYQSDFWHLPNPDLKPMTSKTVEFSIHQRIRKTLSLTVTAYRTRIENLITNVPDNGYTNLYQNKFQGWDVGFIEVPFNLGAQENYGGNVMLNNTFSIRRGRFNIYSSISYLEGEMTEVAASGTRQVGQSLIAPWQFRAGLDGKLNAFHFSVRLLQSGQQRTSEFKDSFENKRTSIPGYSLVNLSAGFLLSDKVTFFTNVQNALNQRYSHPLISDASSTNPISFPTSRQDPSRVMMGIRLAL